MTPQQVLDLPMDDNDAGAKTIREYLASLVEMLWVEGEGFSGKRPFGNSGWEAELLDTFDNADENLSEKSKSNLIREAIRSLKKAPDVPDIANLQRWKEEATIVIKQWEQVWDALGQPGNLGGIKAAAALAEVQRMGHGG